MDLTSLGKTPAALQTAIASPAMNALSARVSLPATPGAPAANAPQTAALLTATTQLQDTTALQTAPGLQVTSPLAASPAFQAAGGSPALSAPQLMPAGAVGALTTLTAQSTASSASSLASVPSLLAAQRAGILSQVAGSGEAAVYHDTGIPSSPTLLTQKGVGAYVQLLNALAGNELQEKSAQALTTRLQSASSALRVAYSDAISDVTPQLESKNWGFSVSNGQLVITINSDVLSPQEVLELRNVLTGSPVESAAKEVANAMTTIAKMRKAGMDPGSLALARMDVEEDNFAAAVDLRSYVTTTAPGGRYHTNSLTPESRSQVPPALGGLDLRGLVTARPRFLRADGSVNPEAVDGLDYVPDAPQISLLRGQCSCGQLQFMVRDQFEYAYYCHCSRCRARTGSAFAAIAGIAIDKMELTAGHEHLLLQGECSDGYGARCSQCYSFIFAAVRGRTYLHVSLGALMDSPSRAPDHHIYVGSKAPWYAITDGLPQYENAT